MPESSPTRPVIELTAGAYSLLPERSTARLTIKHMFGLGTVHATVPLIDGSVQLDTSQHVEVWGRFDATKFSSGNPKRDRDVASTTLLHSAAFPTIDFNGNGALLRRESVLDGELTAAGTTKPVQVLIQEITNDGDLLLVTATAQLQRSAFGITKKKGMVGERVHVQLNLAARPGAPTLTDQAS